MSVLSDKISSLRQDGMSAAHEILRAILQPTVVDGEETVERGSAGAEKALQDLVVGGIAEPGLTVAGLMTKANWITYAAAGTLEDQVTARLGKRFADAPNRDAKVDALLLEREIREAERKVAKRGGEPYAVASTTNTRRQSKPSYGPSWWEANMPAGEPVPALHTIRNILKTLNGTNT